MPLASARQEVESHLQAFVASVNDTVGKWQRKFDDLNEANQRLTIWGAGARCISLLNLCDPGPALDHVIDVNPGRQGRYLPRTAQQIVAPEAIVDLNPHVLLISNPTYAAEIEANARQLGFGGEVWSL
jgi:hypothetical protein